MCAYLLVLREQGEPVKNYVGKWFTAGIGGRKWRRPSRRRGTGEVILQASKLGREGENNSQPTFAQNKRR